MKDLPPAATAGMKDVCVQPTCLMQDFGHLCVAGRAARCLFGLLLQHHCPLPEALKTAKLPCDGSSPDLQPANGQASQLGHQHQQQRTPIELLQRTHGAGASTSASDCAMSDAAGNGSAQGAKLQTQSQHMCHSTAGSDVQSPDQTVSSPEQAASGAIAMTCDSDSYSSESMLASEPVTQDTVNAETPDGAGNQHSSAPVLARASPQLLCLDLSPDALSEGQFKAKDSDDSFSPTAPHAGKAGDITLLGLANLDQVVAARTDSEPSESDLPMHNTVPGSCLEDASPSIEAALRSPLSDPESRISDAGQVTAPVLTNPAAPSSSPASCKTPAVSADDNLPAEAANAASEAARPTATDEMLAASSHSDHAEHQTTKSKWLQQHLLDSHVPHEAVTAFLWSAVRHIVPQVLTL